MTGENVNVSSLIGAAINGSNGPAKEPTNMESIIRDRKSEFLILPLENALRCHTKCQEMPIHFSIQG